METSNKSIASQLKSIGTMVEMAVHGKINALFLYGTPGIGKSSIVMSRFEAAKMKEGEDYVLIKGVTRPMGLYTVLYENRNSKIVFDDCDTAWNDQDSANILKAALEMSGKRVVSYFSKAVKDAGMPTTFTFTGSVIFISNLGKDDVDAAIRSRAYTCGIFATREQMAEFMEYMLDKIEDYVTVEYKREALDYLKSIADGVSSFDLRALIKIINLKVCQKDWKELALLSV